MKGKTLQHIGHAKVKYDALEYKEKPSIMGTRPEELIVSD